MKRFHLIAYAIAAMCLTQWSSVAAGADGAELFGMSSFVSRAEERASLTPSEAKNLELNRTDPRSQNVKLMRLNRSALDSGIIVLAMSEGKKIQYIGAKAESSSRANRLERTEVSKKTFKSWSGRSETGRFNISWNEDSFFGNIYEGGTVYQVHSLPGGRFGVLTQLKTDHLTGRLDIGDGSASAAAASFPRATENTK